ncbi:MAG TPA: GNAT family N-acetyltransferase [Ferruginibacter sp.]|nr:GNAT family N-acetyltransferase [Ferruginibacter sp.]HNF44351.1 GNAT family N-acetyltransferase [Ferruginibacter sp.]HNG63514.1 GNAT family N-acetyltransferase [Ferruginibacter sp.]HNN70433.1 GNAT family N-acetyltransferase [Ferruginibacter sp.]HNO99705.1 GNAT family N-acetyltransferase [Ferruginibacter sp.]
MQILRASTNEQLLLCYGVMKELRPHHTAETFMETIRQMFGEGYQLWYIEDEGKAMCAAGFRITTTFYDGPIIDFDDFVTREDARKKGYAARLFDKLVDIAATNKIKTIHLNSAHHRYDAHRFYLNKKMKIIAHHFRLEV